MSNIQAIVLDLDGTLLDNDKSISPRNYQAVRRCYDYGIHIIVATARPPRVANRFVKELPFVDYLIYYNGALTVCKSKRIQRHISIPMEVSQQIIDFIELQESQSIITFENKDAWYACTPIPDSQFTHFGISSNDDKPLIVEKAFIRSLSPTKILVHGYSAWMELVKQFGEHVNVIATDGGALIQIMPKLASKEDAVQWALDDIGVRTDNVMVFGDDFNDLGLFHKCGFPVAMGNAIAELKNSAKYITESNDQDGVAVALERFVFAMRL
ncbi:Cof-type HAD-IIB family hydrolase [Paenibacillus xylaniclasticus]|uniref:Cof-type HAD-IIB family hydrolase n=1 Tax=Paenibacillus xylaniclasticus TaxID=588083 RepID=UPI000FDA675D|nr:MULTISPECIES: Cof-type HAD-IIB family hydrolase [Paenibacillus]GFN33905.1 haloacid dehalogenase [Paenibacillus curdlanolyticus]